MQCLLFWRFGIFTELESVKYITEANNIIEKGTVSTPNFWLYSTQIFLIATALQLKTGYVGVVIIQLIVNAFATAAFYKLCGKLSNPTIGFWLTLVLIGAFPYQTYNVYLQTESLFFSFCTLFTCYLFTRRQLNWKTGMAIFLFLLLLCITRPSGVLWIPGTILYLTFYFFKQYPAWKKTLVLVTGAFISIFLLNLFIGAGGELDVMLPFTQEHIICGVANTDHASIDTLTTSPNSVAGLWYYITHNFTHFLSLAGEKSFAFWFLYRSYYSTVHNAYLFFYFFPFIILGLAGVFYAIRQQTSLVLFLLSIIILTWLSVLFSCDDWHNRFFFTLFPTLLLLSAFALKKIFYTK